MPGRTPQSWGPSMEPHPSPKTRRRSPRADLRRGPFELTPSALKNSAFPLVCRWVSQQATDDQEVCPHEADEASTFPHV